MKQMIKTETEYVNRIRQELLRQMSKKEDGNLYHDLRIRFAYNSNKIEGSKLSEQDTALMYETDSLIARDSQLIRTDDMIEMRNHFSLFSFTLNHLDESLIKRMHAVLKRGTSDETDPNYNVGDYKQTVNQIGFLNPIHVTSPEDTPLEMKRLLDRYNRKQSISLQDIISFHVSFERIHPFSDGNGRLGRMIMFRECLIHHITPFIISDKNQSDYLRGLREQDDSPGYLTDTCLSEQDAFKELVTHYLRIALPQ